MTLKELRKIIDEIPTDYDGAIIVCQKDSEGNGYSPLGGVDMNNIYVPDCTWSGEIYDTTWTAEDVDMNEKDWEEFKKITDKAIVLFPIN